jgi:hypothetical protein
LTAPVAINTRRNYPVTEKVFLKRVNRQRILLNYLIQQQNPVVTGPAFVFKTSNTLTNAVVETKRINRTRILLNYYSSLSAPSISAVNGMQYLGPTVITGANFGASQGAGTVYIGGWPQSVTTWSNTSITLNATYRGPALYGIPISVSVLTNTGLQSFFTYVAGLTPQQGWAYVNLTSINTVAAYRLTTTPDLSIGDQVAWGNISPVTGTVTVAADASFTTNGNTAQFYFEVNTGDGSGWDQPALQIITNPINPVSPYKLLNDEVSAIINQGLNITPNIIWQYNPVVPYGYVVSVTPTSGTTVNEWSYVTIVVSLGPPPSALTYTVPNVVGLQVYQAEQQCWGAGLDIGQRVYQFSSTVASGYVIAQSLTPLAIEPPGTQIILTVSLGPVPTPTPYTVTVP